MPSQLIARALAEWRAAEARLSGLTPDSRAWKAASRAVDAARERYQEQAEHAVVATTEDVDDPQVVAS